MDNEKEPQNASAVNTAKPAAPKAPRVRRGRLGEMILVAGTFVMAGAGLALGIMAKIDQSDQADPVPVTAGAAPVASLHAFGVAEIEGTAQDLVVDLTARQPSNEPASTDLTAAMDAVRSVLGLAGIQPGAIEVEGPHLGDEGTSSTWVTLIAPLPEGTSPEDAAGISAQVMDAVRAVTQERVEVAVSASPRLAGGEESLDGALEAAVQAAVVKLAEREGVDREQIEVLDHAVLWARSDDRSAQVAVQITAVIDELERTA